MLALSSNSCSEGGVLIYFIGPTTLRFGQWILVSLDGEHGVWYVALPESSYVE